MAATNNTLTAVVPQLLAQGLMALRENAIMPLIVNRSYETMAGERGSTIDIPIPSAFEVNDVTGHAWSTAPAAQDLAPTSVSIPLNRHKEVNFALDDKQRLEIMNGVLPMQASEAVKALANEVDQFLLGLGNQFFGIVDLSGTDAVGQQPFGDGTTADAVALRTVLNQQLAPMDPRYVVVDPVTEGAALGIRAFQDASFGGGPQALINGDLQRKFGMMWLMDQNVQTHTHGTADGTWDLAVNNGGGYSIGDTSIAIDATTTTGTLTAGDIVKFANHSQTYVVTAAVPDVTSGTMTIQPPLVAAVDDNDSITFADGTAGAYELNSSHVMNLAFHRDAIAFATRPLARSAHPGSIVETATDPISGLSLRLEVQREWKRDRYSFDILYGGAVIRRELGARLPAFVA